MAINVNTVYQTVLSILNKEQRGYLTPDEFNKIATQVQLEIFEQYFEDLNQQLRGPGFEDEYADRVDNIEEKISIFKTQQPLVYIDENNGEDLEEPFFISQNQIHRLGTVIYKHEQEVEMTNRAEFLRLNMSKLTRPSEKYPLYIQEGLVNVIDDQGAFEYENVERFFIYPRTIMKDVSISFIRKPKNVVWAYFLGSNLQYIWDGANSVNGPLTPSSGSVNFEIDDTDQTEVILRILMYAGVVIRDQQIVQAAAAQIQAVENNQKT